MYDSDRGRLPVVGLVGTVLLLAAALFLPTNIFENLDAQHIMVVQSPVSGQLTLHTDPGVKWQGFGKVTKYLRRDQFSFDVADKSQIKARFNDGGHADISGGVAWEMPTDREHLLTLHAKYGSQDTIEGQLVKTVVEKAIYMTGPLMSSKESSAERRNEMLGSIEDQIQHGIYQTRTDTKQEPDPMTGTLKTVSVVTLVKDTNGMPKRQESSPLTDFGIKVFNLSLNGIQYDDTVEKQIQEQQRAVMNVQTAMANAKKAEQDAITAEKNGQAEAAKAKWAQEALKATAVTQGEQELAVANLARQTAEQNKQQQILLGQGEAERRRLNLAANGALEQKLSAYVEVNKAYAEAIKDYKGAWTPNVVMGASPNNGGNASQNLVELLTAKTARDLGVDVTPK
jgi:regulator of protease activity HflC (stomatin/prohibitin superfamily)